MPSRDFICTPSEWTDDPILNGLTDDAELLFRRLASCTDGKWRFSIDPANVAHSIRTAVFRPQRRFRAWNPDRVHRCLTELTQAGMLTRQCHADRHWLEVAERWRYEKGRDPVTGESAPLPPTPPPELPLGPLDPVRPRNGKRGDSESKKSKATDSPHSENLSLPKGATLNQNPAQERGDKSGTHDRWLDASADPLWPRLCKALGRSEMRAWGAGWLAWLEQNRDAMNTALTDYEASDQRIPAAAYINKAYNNAARRTA